MANPVDKLSLRPVHAAAGGYTRAASRIANVHAEDMAPGSDLPEESTFQRDRVLFIRQLDQHVDPAQNNTFILGKLDYVPLDTAELDQYISQHPQMWPSLIRVLRTKLEDRMNCLSNPPSDIERSRPYMEFLFRKFCGQTELAKISKIKLTQIRARYVSSQKDEKEEQGEQGEVDDENGSLSQRESLLFRTLATFENKLFLGTNVLDRERANSLLSTAPPRSWLLRSSSVRNSLDGTVVMVALSHVMPGGVINHILIGSAAGLGFFDTAADDVDLPILRSRGMPNAEERRYIVINNLSASLSELLTKLSEMNLFDLNKFISI